MVYVDVNPFTAPACKISRLKNASHTDLPENSIFDGSYNNSTVSIKCILICKSFHVLVGSRRERKKH